MAFLVALGFVGLQVTITSLVLGFTSRNSTFRPGALPLLILCAYIQLPYLQDIASPSFRAFAGGAGIVAVILYIDTVLVHRWTFAAKGPTSSQGGLTPVEYRAPANSKPEGTGVIGDALERIRFGFYISLQTRFPATKWPVKNLPPFSRKDPGYVPGKGEFLRGMIIRWIIFVILLDLRNLVGDDGNNAITFSSERVPFFIRLASVSREEMIARILSVSAYWIIQSVVIEVFYRTLAIVEVTLGLTAVNVWPPLFGSIGDSYSIRQFWGCSYHQLVRRGCSSIAYFVTYSSLRLKKGGLIGRYLFILLTFSVSGFFHTFSDSTQGVPWRESGAMQFFCVQTLGIMIEDAVQALYRSWRGDKAGRSHFAVTVLGYVWVVAWLVWSTPRWTYPMLRRYEGEPILPFSLIGILKA